MTTFCFRQDFGVNGVVHQKKFLDSGMTMYKFKVVRKMKKGDFLAKRQERTLQQAEPSSYRVFIWKDRWELKATTKKKRESLEYC